MYVCMYGHHIYSSKSKDQPGKVPNPARRQPFAPANLVLRDGFGSPVPRQPARAYTQAITVDLSPILNCTVDPYNMLLLFLGNQSDVTP